MSAAPREIAERDAVPIDSGRRRARGASSNASGRYEPERREEDDGWDIPLERDGFATEIRQERVRAIISYNRSPDLPFDRAVNPYRGCEHGCSYCFARPSHAWLGLSPGLDFETRIVARPNAADALRRELSARRYRPATIALGSSTDPYQPAERDLGITRACLETLREFSHPVAVVTKGALVERDVDVIAPMAELGLARVGISLTTLDPKLSRSMEPRAPGPERRLRAIRKLADAGIPVRAMIAPVVPGLTDHEIESLLEAAREAGARAATWIMLRLPREVSPIWREWLQEHRPDAASRIMGRIREMHGGKDYDSRWGRRMRGEGRHAELVARRFRVAARRHGLDRDLGPLRCDLFSVPAEDGQQDLFG